MKNKAVLVLILVICFSGATSAQVETTRLLKDQVGREVRVPNNPRRIVSLIPSLTEIVYDLGRGDLLVGATKYAREPAPAARLPRVGTYLHLDIERIVGLKPDLCLGTRDGNPEHLVRRIEEMGIPVFAFDPKTIPEIIESVQIMGELLGAPAEAKAISRALEEKLADVDRRVRLAGSRPGVFFLIDTAPMVSAGSGTFIDRMITRAGGRNLAAGPVSYPRFSWEDILTLQPEIVIIASMAGGYTEKQLKEEWLKWPSIPAVRNGRIYVVDAGLFDRPVPRLVDGLVMLTDLFHPDTAR